MVTLRVPAPAAQKKAKSAHGAVNGDVNGAVNGAAQKGGKASHASKGGGVASSAALPLTIRCTAVSPAGLLVCGCDDGSICVWEVMGT